MAQTVRTHLAEVANGLEPAKALKVEIATSERPLTLLANCRPGSMSCLKHSGNAAESSATSKTGAGAEI